MKLVWIFSLNSNKPQPFTLLIIFMSGIEEEIFSKRIPPHNND
jgi:hypothetical protein